MKDELVLSKHSFMIIPNATQLKTLEVVPTSQSDAKHWQYENLRREKFLDNNRRNSSLCTVRSSRQRSCNQRVGCLLCSILRSMIYGMGLWTSARCMVWSLAVVRMAIKIKNRNTPQIHTYTLYISTFQFQRLQIPTIAICRQRTLWFHDIYMVVLTVNGNVVRLFCTKAFIPPYSCY